MTTENYDPIVNQNKPPSDVARTISNLPPPRPGTGQQDPSHASPTTSSPGGNWWRYLTPMGRARRSEYVIVHIAALALWVGVFSMLPTDSSGEIAGNVPTALGVIVGVGGVLGFWLILTVTVRRFHDLGSTGWLILATIIPIVGWILGFQLLFKDGERWSNKYGRSPKAL